jgi:hypothetical protein
MTSIVRLDQPSLLFAEKALPAGSRASSASRETLCRGVVPLMQPPNSSVLAQHRDIRAFEARDLRNFSTAREKSRLGECGRDYCDGAERTSESVQAGALRRRKAGASDWNWDCRDCGRCGGWDGDSDFVECGVLPGT